jgi:hypothetical protein
MAKPLIPVEVIYEHASALIDAEGAQALSAPAPNPPLPAAEPHVDRRCERCQPQTAHSVCGWSSISTGANMLLRNWFHGSTM